MMRRQKKREGVRRRRSGDVDTCDFVLGEAIAKDEWMVSKDASSLKASQTKKEKEERNGKRRIKENDDEREEGFKSAGGSR